MSQDIHSILILKFSITNQSEEGASNIIENFVHDRIYKGSRPIEFFTRPSIYKSSTPIIYPKNDQNLLLGYQVIRIETKVEHNLSEIEYLSLFENYIRDNMNDHFSNQIIDITIIQHEIVNRYFENDE
ncbi:MAG: hypothetical protein ACPKOP_04005 [Sphaerochaetaceae bacterium]